MRQLKRKSDNPKSILPRGPQGGAGRALCPNCKESYLKLTKDDSFNLTCVTCGEKVLLNEVRYDVGLTYDGAQVTTIVKASSDKWRRKPKPREKDPLYKELTDHGLQVIDTDWRDNRESAFDYGRR